MKKILIAWFLVLGIVLGGNFSAFPVSSDKYWYNHRYRTVAIGFCIRATHGSQNPAQSITYDGNSSVFGFSVSPGPQNGAFFLDILVPNNY